MELLLLMYGSQAAQLQTFRNSCVHAHDGPVLGLGGPFAAELLDVTGQVPITQILSRRWLGHAALKPDTGKKTADCRLHPRAPQACRL